MTCAPLRSASNSDSLVECGSIAAVVEVASSSSLSSSQAKRRGRSFVPAGPLAPFPAPDSELEL